MYRVSRLPLLAALLALLVPAGCGWQLRGSYDLPPELVPVALEGGGALARDLERNLQRIGALDGGEPASRLEILEETDNRRVVAVDADGKVSEYEVRYTVRWQLTAPSSAAKGRRVLIAPRTLQASRTYNFDSASTLSKSEEEKARIEAMRDDIAQQILFRLQGWQPPSADDGAGAAPE